MICECINNNGVDWNHNFFYFSFFIFFLKTIVLIPIIFQHYIQMSPLRTFIFRWVHWGPLYSDESTEVLYIQMSPLRTLVSIFRCSSPFTFLKIPSVNNFHSAVRLNITCWPRTFYFTVLIEKYIGYACVCVSIYFKLLLLIYYFAIFIDFCFLILFFLWKLFLRGYFP